MSGANIHCYRKALEAELAPRLATRGMLVSTEWSDDEELVFSGRVPAVPGLATSVSVIVDHIKDVHRLYGSASLISIDVAEVIRDLPQEASMSEWEETSHGLGRVDLTIFSEHIDPGEYNLYAMYDTADVVDAARWFMRCVEGPVGEWFSHRDDLTKLVAQAKRPVPNAVNDESPHPKLVRTTVILCVLNGRLADAAALMGWYLACGLIGGVDSYEKATAFDMALQERFPGYTQARALMA